MRLARERDIPAWLFCMLKITAPRDDIDDHRDDEEDQQQRFQSVHSFSVLVISLNFETPFEVYHPHLLCQSDKTAYAIYFVRADEGITARLFVLWITPVAVP